MKIEHVAYMVEDPPTVADWYVEHLGLAVVRKMDAGPRTHFLADDSGRTMLEIYNNPAATVPDYRTWHPLNLHIAFVSADIDNDRDRLLSAGATLFEDTVVTDAGDQLCMLRDPWGLAIQLCRRADPMPG